MRQLDRYRNDDIPIGGAELPELRAYFHGWVQELGQRGRTGASEHEKTHNLVVAGSSPTRPTIDTNGFSVFQHYSEALFSPVFPRA